MSVVCINPQEFASSMNFDRRMSGQVLSSDYIRIYLWMSSKI